MRNRRLKHGVKLVEERREGAEFEESGDVAYYATWPLQVYMDSFLVSNNIALTYSCKESWETEEWFSSKEGEGSGSSYTVIEKKANLKINAGTVACSSITNIIA